MRTIDETTLQSYKNHIYTQEKSQNTIDKYIRDIRTFTAWLQTQEHKDITKDCVIRYKKYLEAHYRPSSTNSMLTALNGFFEYTGWHDCRVIQIDQDHTDRDSKDHPHNTAHPVTDEHE